MHICTDRTTATRDGKNVGRAAPRQLQLLHFRFILKFYGKFPDVFVSLSSTILMSEISPKLQSERKRLFSKLEEKDVCVVARIQRELLHRW